MLEVCEIFKSIQGESTFAGMPCAFVRLSRCNLTCTYCDTEYAREKGTMQSIDRVLEHVAALKCRLVEVTGGEPLLQDQTPLLCARLLEAGHAVLVETNGTIDITKLAAGCIRIMDVKCPGSGMGGSFRTENLKALRAEDECKFVLTDKEDFEWAHDFVRAHKLARACTVQFTPVFGVLDPKELAEWILSRNLPVRLGLQLHKVIWGENVRMV